MADVPSPEDDWGDPTEIMDGAGFGSLAAGDVAPGTKLGRYEILMPVASGGMARVWAARMQGQRGFSKLVAIKTILPHLAEDPEFERMFLDEARIAAGVHHPNVCELYELGEEGDVLYLAMEWVSGDSLFHVLRVESGGSPVALEPRIAARIVADACAGLHSAHQLEGDDGKMLGVVHRDVSPQNVLLSLDGHAKVADFGVAKALGQVHNATMAGQLRGKIHYMSPEQVSGAPVDRRSDVFSLGCVLYEATTGIKAFDGEAEHLAMQAIVGGKYLKPSQLLPGYPPALEAIVARAIATDPAARFPTAERMRAALEQFLAKSGTLVVGHADVARVARQRIGVRADRRKERLKKAMAAMGERAPMPSVPPEGVVSSGRASLSHSGVLATGTPSSSPPRSAGPLEVTAVAPSAHARGTAAPAYGTPPPAAFAAARDGFDLMDPPIPSVPPPPDDVADMVARVEAPHRPLRAKGGGHVLIASAVALVFGVFGGLAWRALQSPPRAPAETEVAPGTSRAVTDRAAQAPSTAPPALAASVTVEAEAGVARELGEIEHGGEPIAPGARAAGAAPSAIAAPPASPPIAAPPASPPSDGVRGPRRGGSPPLPANPY